jgi:hypothetical protein
MVAVAPTPRRGTVLRSPQPGESRRIRAAAGLEGGGACAVVHDGAVRSNDSRSELPYEWRIGLASWVLQDGNYTAFAVGQRRQFALEFHYDRNERLRPVDRPASRRCAYTGSDSLYDVTAHLKRDDVERTQRDAFVLDFGHPAYTRWMVLDDLEPPRASTWLRGPIRLSVDPFDYMDERIRPHGLPPMIFTWTITGIERSTTPRVRVEHGHPLYVGPDKGPRLVADPAAESWEPVRTTPVWDDADYRLSCVLDPSPPTDTMRRSGPRSPYGPLSASPSDAS